MHALPAWRCAGRAAAASDYDDAIVQPRHYYTPTRTPPLTSMTIATHNTHARIASHNNRADALTSNPHCDTQH
jgi:hypothetical protein